MIEDKLGDLLSFLQVVTRNEIVPLAYTLSLNKKISIWSKSMHDSCIWVIGIPSPGSLMNIKDPIDITINILNDMLV